MCIVRITAGNRWHTQTELFDGSLRRGYLRRWGRLQGNHRDSASDQSLTTRRPAWTKGATYDWDADRQGSLDEAMTFDHWTQPVCSDPTGRTFRNWIFPLPLCSFCTPLFFFFFLMWTIFKVFIEFITLSLLFFIFLFFLMFWFFSSTRHVGS